MYFIIPNYLGYSSEEKSDMITKLAAEQVYIYRITPSQTELDNYLQKHYQASLKTLCNRLIWTKLKISADIASKNFIVSFIDTKSDDLAKLITYGNSEVKGCNILQIAFKQEY